MPAPQLICGARSERTSPVLSITRVLGVARPVYREFVHWYISPICPGL
jgi:hypothetical protein